MKKRRISFWILLAVFILAVVWWSLHVPYVPERLYSAVPPGATFVSAHTDIAGRWDAFSANPLTRSLLSSVGVDLVELDKAAGSASFRKWLRELASDELVIAYTPSLGGTRQGAWVFASWIGGRSQRLRALSSSSQFPCKRLGRHAGWTLWTVENRALPSASRVSFALTEGMLVGCVAKSPGAIRYVLDWCDGWAYEGGEDVSPTSRILSVLDEGACDRGVVLSDQEGDVLWSYALSALAPAFVEGEVRFRGPFGASRRWNEGADLGELDRLFGDLPLALVGLSAQPLRLVLEAWRPSPGAETALTALEDFGVQGLTLCVLGGEYSGRLGGIRLPALVIGVPVEGEEQALAAAARVLDRLNARYQWGLIPREVPANGGSLQVIESTASTDYAEVDFHERVAYAVRGKWFVLASNADTLKKLLQRHHALSSVGEAPWSAELEALPTLGGGWIDLVKGGKAVKDAASAYSLKLAFENPERTQQVRQRLNETKAWADALAPLAVCRLRLESRAQGLTLLLKMGESP